jgi:hypothetical protein
MERTRLSLREVKESVLCFTAKLYQVLIYSQNWPAYLSRCCCELMPVLLRGTGT